MKHLEFNRFPKQALPNIDWNNEGHVSSLTAHMLRLYLKQHNLQVSGGKATLVATRSTLRSGCSTNTGTRRAAI